MKYKSENNEKMTIRYENSIDENSIKKEINIFTKLENFKLNVFKSKQALVEDQLLQQNELLNEIMENNINQMKEDIKRMKNKEKLTKISYANDLSKSIKKFKSDLNNNRYTSLKMNKEIMKIKEYKEKVSMTTLDLIRFLDSSSYSTGKISISVFEKGLIKHKILFENEALSLVNILKKYFKDDFILNEAFENIFDDSNNLFAKEKNSNSEDDEEDSEVENEFLLAKLNDEYEKVKDFIELEKNQSVTKGTLLHSHKEKILSTRNIGQFQYIIKMKVAIQIQALVRGFITRLKFKKYKKNLDMAMTKINSHARKMLVRKNFRENRAALKIQLLLKKNYSIRKKEWLMYQATMNMFLKDKKDMTRNFAATTIQRYWRLSRKVSLTKYNSKYNSDTIKVQETLVKYKYCFICSKNKVEFICKDCDNTNYCKEDYLRYHSKGGFKNHRYMQIQKNDIVKREKFSDENVDGLNILKLREFLKENEISLYEHLKLWDFNNDNKIKLRHLKDALSIKFFNLSKEIIVTIINLAHQFIIKEKADREESLINIEELCYELAS